MPKKHLLRSLLLLPLYCLLALSYGCDEEVTPPVVERYPDEVAQIFEKKCVSCHNATQRESRLDLSTWSGAFKGSSNNSTIIPYSVEWSHLLWHINSFGDTSYYATQPYMPITTASLTTGNYVWDSTNRVTRAEFDALVAWIAAGAPSKNGALPWADRRTTSGGKFFALNSGSDVVAVVDLATNLNMHMIPVGQNPNKSESPHFVTLSPDKQFLYVTLIEGSVVEKYRTDNYQFVGRATVGESPAHIKISPDGQYAVVTHWTTSQSSAPRVTLLNANNMQVLDVINDASNELTMKPHGIALLPDFSAVYVTNNAGSSLTKIKIKNGRFNDDELPELIRINPTIGPLQAVYQPYDLVISPNGQDLIVTCQGTGPNYDSSQVVRINMASGAVTGVIRLNPANPDNSCGRNPRLVTSDGNRVYVACRLSELSTSGNQKGSVMVIDPASFTLVRHIARVGQYPHGLSVDPNTNRLYITSENLGGVDPPHHFVPGMSGSPGHVNLVDLNTFQVLINDRIEIAIYPTGTAIIP